MKQINVFFLVAVTLLLFTNGCSKSSTTHSSSSHSISVSGIYENDDAEGLIQSIEFNHGHALITTGIGGFSTKIGAPYKIKNNQILFEDPERGTAILSIVDAKTLRGETFGYEGTFVKE